MKPEAAPKAGDVFRSLRPIDVIVMTNWRAPFTGGNAGVLPANERFRVSFDPPATATAVHCVVERYDELHASLVPASTRISEGYAGYDVVISFESLRRDCERVA